MHSPTEPEQIKPARASSAAGWIGPLLAMLVVQATSAFLSRLIPTLAPTLMAELGWSETEIGYLAALNTVGSILFLLSGAPLMWRTGPIRAL
jgi:hypothetical protein